MTQTLPGTAVPSTDDTAQLTPVPAVVPPALTPPGGPETTTPASNRPEATSELRRRTAGVRASDVWAAAGALAAALSTTCLVYFVIAPFSGILGFVVLAYLAFLGYYALLVSFDEAGPIVRDRVVSVVVHSLALLLLAGLILVVVFTVIKGLPALRHLNFYAHDVSRAGPLQPLSVGGILHAVIGTLEQITIALTLTVPLGLTCALFLSEVPGRFSRLVRTIAEAMTALPSIVAGLFIYATYILILGGPKSGFAASLALSVMMLPIIIRASDVVIRLVPGTLREASLGVGASRWRTMWHVVLPTARSGLVTAVILGTARGIGETSPVLLTAGYTAVTNTNPFNGPQVSLPLATFEFVRSPRPNVVARGFGAAATLLVLVIVLFVIARIIGGRPAGQLTKRQERRRVRESAKDNRRYAARQSATTNGSQGQNQSPNPTQGPTRPPAPAAAAADNPAPDNPAPDNEETT